MATIKDIAKKAGVSITSVSQVLNNKDMGIKEETKEKILAAARELDYKPNYLARGLITKKTNTLGLIIPDITNPFFPQVVRAIEDTANYQGYNMILCNTDDDVDKEKLYLRVLEEKCVDGIIFTSSTKSSKSYLDHLENNDTPFVLLDRSFSGPLDFPKVYTDGYKGIKLAMNHLITRGHRDIAFLSGPETSQTAKDRLEGYRQALSEAGLTPESESQLIYYGDYKALSGEQGIAELLDTNPHITAVVAANDLMAVGAMRTIKNRGLKIPEDISIIGFDNIQTSRLVDPPLTTVAQPSYQMGQMATDILIDMIEKTTNITGKSTHPETNQTSQDFESLKIQEVKLEPELIIRNSVK
ncbi:LacI family DNA-binding transcriptional regulator [Natranaerobius thermophilus]|uniref:Transcriptional regulator, LacI family n=1 Tax=Natranaerobius thermophilus (strain ATCC BAA-1301 / DSM 18059 / JW/NM-WN-LF) TaxID=457570 RepID=B2A2D9_NATTJ|nr:LacI family DNA-binding transcriptional regulator [Natranaerobius thermophilus]ACB86245.1 transcriptional regulator, LacI family [Natranaerobius thermophilus JW/NM-WN-LF]